MSISDTKSKKMTERRKEFNMMRRIQEKRKKGIALTEEEREEVSIQIAYQPGSISKAERTGWTQDEYTNGMSIELGEEWGKKYKQASPERKREIIEMYLNNEINPDEE